MNHYLQKRRRKAFNGSIGSAKSPTRIGKKRNEEELKVKAKQEDERKKLLEETEKKKAEMERKKIEEENKRKLVEKRTRQQDLENKRLPEDTSTAQAAGRAKAAVRRRINKGREKSSPTVWAAVRALSEFVESQENVDRTTDVPQNILMAIIQLTDFLNMEETLAAKEKKTENEKEQSSVSPNQQRLREQILKQRQQQEQEIAECNECRNCGIIHEDRTKDNHRSEFYKSETIAKGTISFSHIGSTDKQPWGWKYWDNFQL